MFAYLEDFLLDLELLSTSPDNPFLSSLIDSPILLESSGIFFPPNKTRTINKIIISSWNPMPNIVFTFYLVTLNLNMKYLLKQGFTILVLLLILVVLPVYVFAAPYGEGSYGGGVYNEGVSEATATPTPTITPTATPTVTPTPTLTPTPTIAPTPTVTPTVAPTSTPTPTPTQTATPVVTATPTQTPALDNDIPEFSSATTPGCGDAEPGSNPPWLYGAIAQDSTSVLLYFTPADGFVDKYILEYGEKEGEYRHGVGDLGVNSDSQMTFLVEQLSPNTTYYFRVRAGNGCTVGPWSNVISEKTFSALNLVNQFTNQSLKTDITEAEIEKDAFSVPTPSLSPSPSPSPTPSITIIPDTGQKTLVDVSIKVEDENKNAVQGAVVTLYSTPRQEITDVNGIAHFNSVESGEHRVVIEYRNKKAEQTIFVPSDGDEISFSIEVKPANPTYNRWAIAGIGVLAVLAIFLIVRLIVVAKQNKLQN